MIDREESRFDALLRDHFAAKLDGELGKSVERFMHDVPSASAPMMRLAESAPAEPEVRGHGWRSLAWSLGLAGAAVAAGVAVVMMFSPALVQSRLKGGSGIIAKNDSMDLDPSPPVSSQNETALIWSNVAENVEHALSWQTVDRGTVYLDDDTPLRNLVRQQVETLSWYDPKNDANVQMQIPRSDVVFVGYQSQ